MPSRNDAGEGLERSLRRTRTALERGRTSARSALPAKAPPGPLATALGAIALALFVAAFVTGHPWLLWFALAAAAAGGLLFASGQARSILGGVAGSGHAQIGMGATVAADARIEPGARVEMGAEVGPRALVRSGAVVRMGASVGADAVIERSAIVSWGASVHEHAVVEEGATVGAGGDVRKGSRVPAGMWLKPGSTFGGTTTTPIAPSPRSEPDPRAARVNAVCDKLEGELRAAPERTREFLGGSVLVIPQLRDTCQDLARRERELRAESDPAALQRLEEERSALEQRLAREPDGQIVASLRGALAAIDEQKRERALLGVAADRVEAEHTRLLYTMEGLAAQFVRMRTAGAQARPVDLTPAITQLRDELDAIANALDETTRTSALSHAAEAPADATRESPQPARVRE